MEKQRVDLGAIQQTLLIPLLGRALETRKRSGLLHDPRAVAIVEQLDYDFSPWEQGPSMLGTVLRTRMIDEDVKAFLSQHSSGTVVEIGCGLNGRFERVDNGRVRWFDLDLPDAIRLRRQFFSDSSRQTMLAADVLDLSWMEEIQSAGGPFCFISEAALIYLEPADAERVIQRIAAAFPGSWLLMDTTPQAMVAGQARHDAMKHLPRSSWFRWTVDDPRQLEGLGLSLVRSRSFLDADPEIIEALPWLPRLLFRWAPWLLRRRIQGYCINQYRLQADAPLLQQPAGH
jgi:O-methyltransferase involved in polyketide biosynthesis